MEQELNLKEELLKIIRAHIASVEPMKEKGSAWTHRKRTSGWIHTHKTRLRMYEKAMRALTRMEEGGWMDQLTTIIKEFEEEAEDKPEWKSTLEKLKFGNQGSLKELGQAWKSGSTHEYPYLVPVAMILGLMEEDNSLTLLEALERATSPGKKYSQYNWVQKDLDRLEGKQDQEHEQENQEKGKKSPPKEKRKRGGERVKRVMQSLADTKDDGIALKANGRNLLTVTERNLDYNKVSFSTAVTRNINTPGHKTPRIDFFSKSRTTIFEREPEEDIKEKILTLLQEGKTRQDAAIEIAEKATLLKTWKGVEKEEESLDFYKSEKNANKTKKARVWKMCMICHDFGYRWEIQEGLMQRHLKNFHKESLKTDMLDLSKGQSQEALKEKKELVKTLTPVVKIQHLEPEEKRELIFKEPFKADPLRRYRKRYEGLQGRSLKGDTEEEA